MHDFRLICLIVAQMMDVLFRFYWLLIYHKTLLITPDVDIQNLIMSLKLSYYKNK